MKLGRTKLGLFDTTSLVVGAVVGADIYVVAAQGAGLLGPAALVAWLTGGFMAMAIALTFIQCAIILPRAGGSYSYVSDAFGHLPGFFAGWCLYLALLLGSAVFPLAFIGYLHAAVPSLEGPWELLVRSLFIAFVTLTNYAGVVVAGRINDALTIAKLIPLILLVLATIPWVILDPGAAAGNLLPFAPLGWAGFVAAINPIFWAYAGFEVASLPGGEIDQPKRTLPLALVWGMIVVTVLYLLVNLSTVVALPWQGTANSETPLVDAAVAIFGGLGLPSRLAGAFMTMGAAIAIAGVSESVTLAIARLALAMARDGYLPRFLTKESRRFSSPAAVIVFQGVAIFALSFLANIEILIAASVLYLSLVYFATAIASYKLSTEKHQKGLPVPLLWLALALAVPSSFLLAVSSFEKAWPIAAAGLLLAVPFYLHIRGRR